jgi:MFS family permease
VSTPVATRLPVATLLRVLVPFATGYFLSYLYRSVNAVIAPDLSAALGLDAADLGLLTSVYFLTFSLFQLPLGLLLDRFGPRRVEAVLLLVAASGALLFAISDDLGGLIAGRALIGLGVSACLMASLKATAIWFDQDRVPAMNAWIVTAGGLGALTATAPVEAALTLTSWRGVIGVLAGATVLAAVLIFFMVPERPRQSVGGLRELLGGVVRVYRSVFFWRAVPLVVLTQGAYLSIQGLWAGPWFQYVAGLDRAGVAHHLFFTAVAMVAGFLLLGHIASRLTRLGISLRTTTVVCLLLFMLTQLLLMLLPTTFALPVWMAFGFFGSAGILAFPVLSQHFPAELTGRVNTAANVMVFLCAFLSQWAIGAVINLWPVAEGYHPHGFQAAFALFLSLQVAGFLWFLPLLRRRTQPGTH